MEYRSNTFLATVPIIITFQNIDYCLLARRCLYLPALNLKFFNKDKLLQTWFSYKKDGAEIPCRDNYPIGLLYDLYAETTVWNITLHTGLAPQNILHESTKELYYHSLKMADYIRNGNCKKVMGLSKDDQELIYNSIIDSQFENYSRIIFKLETENMKSIPLKLYDQKGDATIKLVEFQNETIGKVLDWQGPVIIHGIDVKDIPVNW
jgi:hypothetical protein